MTITPTEALAQQAHCRPDSTAFTFREDVWTYRRLADESECVARGLARSGVKAGDRVALHMVNRPEMLVAYYACFRLGAIATPIRTVLIQAELARILQRLQPALYIGESALYANVAPIDTAILPREKRFVVGDVDQSHAVQPWEALKQAPQSELPIPPSDRIAVLMETSGSTGQPKLIAHTLDTLAEMAELIYKAFGLAEQDVIVSPLRLAHGTGLYCSLTFVRFGLPFFMLQTFDADIVLDAVERYRGTWLLGFPYQYAGLIEAQQAKPRNVSSLRMCLTGADVCPVDQQNRFASVFGVPLRNIWGSTEGAGQLAFGLQPGPVLRIGEERQVRIVDEDGADVARDEVGELLIHGPGVFVGYWNDPAETAASLKDGWYHTGDWCDTEGATRSGSCRARRTSSFAAGPISRPPRWKKPCWPAIRQWRKQAPSASPIRCSVSGCSPSSSSRLTQRKASSPRYFRTSQDALRPIRFPKAWV